MKNIRQFHNLGLEINGRRWITSVPRRLLFAERLHLSLDFSFLAKQLLSFIVFLFHLHLQRPHLATAHRNQYTPGITPASCTSTLRELHWLPVPVHSGNYTGFLYHIRLPTSFAYSRISSSQAPSYLTDIVTQTATDSSRSRLRSASSLRYEQPHARLKLGQRAFLAPHQRHGTLFQRRCRKFRTPELLNVI